MATKTFVAAVLSDRDADRLLKSLPKDTVKWTERVDVERLMSPEHATGMGKRAGGRIFLQMRDAEWARSQSDQV